MGNPKIKKSAGTSNENIEYSHFQLKMSAWRLKLHIFVDLCELNLDIIYSNIQY